MALGDKTLGVIFFFLVLSFIFPVSTYALTYDYGSIDTEIESGEAFLEQGILITESATFNYTVTDGYSHQYTFNGSDCKLYYFPASDLFEAWCPTWPMGWLFSVRVDFTDNNGNNEGQQLTDAEIIGDYDPNLNYSRYSIDQGGENEMEMFLFRWNITATITENLNADNSTVTCGMILGNLPSSYIGFAQWYFSFIIGTGTFGMPQFFIWIFQILFLMGLVCAILLIREFIPFLP